MADDKSLSYILRHLLNSLGLDEDHRQRRITCQKMAQLLANFSNAKLPFIIELLTGSSFEATTIDGLSSDLDVMYVYPGLRIISNIEDWKDDGIITYLMDSTDCYSTFVKLYRLSLDYPGPMYGDMWEILPLWHEVDLNGQVLLKNSIIEIVREIHYFRKIYKGDINGPAYTSDHFGMERDHVATLRCNVFPREALGWKQRQTPLTRTRIDPAIIDGINHCYLVPSGDATSRTGHLQWRMTLSHIEHKLVHAWNNVQYQCYILMKFIKKDFISPFVPEALKSYHFKTLIFWMNEEYPAEFFIASNFEFCALACLKNLLASVTKRSLPQYFVTDCNLFHPRLTKNITTARKLAGIIENIIATWPYCLSKISGCNLGRMFRDCLACPSSLPGMCATVRQRRLLSGVRYEILSEFHLIEWRLCEMRKAFFIKSTEVFQLLCKLITNSNYNHEHRQLVDFLTKDILCNYSLDQITCDNSMSNKRAARNITAGLRYIQRYSNSCCIDTGLKIAAHFIMTGNYSGALSALGRVEEQIKTATGFRCYHDQCGDYYAVGDRNIEFNRTSMKEYFLRYIGTAVTYRQQNMSHIPKGLVYEMFRSTSVSPLSDPLLYDWHQHAIIQCPVYLYYLHFLNQQALGSSENRRVALDGMVRASKEVSKCSHRETNHNIIGHCYRSIGDTRRAYKEYRKSLEAVNYNNAVIWHLAVLLRSKIRVEL